MSVSKDVVEILHRLSELERRVAGMVRHGTVAQVDAAKGLARIRLGGTDDKPLLGPWTPYAQLAGALKAHIPVSVGQQVTLLSPSGDPRQGVLMPMTWTTSNAAPGQTAAENVVTFGGVTLKMTGDGLSITGKLSVTGDFAASGGAFTHNAKNVGATHKHTGVEPGSGKSGPPE